jgi:hypothetical protein
MTEQRATPTPLIGLRLLRGDTAAPDTSAAPDTRGDTEAAPAVSVVPDAGGDTAPAPAPVPVSGAEVVPLSPAERARLAGKYWAALAANGAGRLWLDPGRLGHLLYNGKPGSLAEHRDYIKSREWRPEELKDHGSGKVIAGLGVGYHLVIARPLKAACLIVSASADRPLRLTGLIAFLIVFAVFVLPHLPLI